MTSCDPRRRTYVVAMKKQTRKLMLEREAVRTLSVEDTRQVRGGDGDADARKRADLVMYNVDGTPVSRYHL